MSIVFWHMLSTLHFLAKRLAGFSLLGSNNLTSYVFCAKRELCIAYGFLMVRSRLII